MKSGTIYTLMMSKEFDSELHNEELNNLYSSPHTIRMIKPRGKAWGGDECIQGFSGKARRKETTRRLRLRWEDNTKMGLRKRGWCGMD
jgi:hypothetical protein